MCQIIYISAQNPDSDDYSGHLGAMGAPPRRMPYRGVARNSFWGGINVLERYKTVILMFNYRL